MDLNCTSDDQVMTFAMIHYRSTGEPKVQLYICAYNQIVTCTCETKLIIP